MARRHNPRPKIGVTSYSNPRRNEVWLAVDRNQKHNGKESEREYEDNVQGGTRTCIVVSNNTGNTHSPNVEVVFTTTKEKADLPTHFTTTATPEPSIVLCEEIMTVSKKDLTRYYGKLNSTEKAQLDECLKISLGLK